MYNFNKGLEYLQKYKINIILIAIPNLSIFEKEKILNKFSNFNVQIKIIPTVNDLIDGKKISKMSEMCQLKIY